jgi:membrane-associated phospholipid phosphatase
VAAGTSSALDGPVGSGQLSETIERAASIAASGRSPQRSLLTVALAGYAALAVGLVLVGEVIVHTGLLSGLRAWDEHVSQWFVGRRTTTGAHVTAFWTEVANTEGIVVVGLLVEMVLAVRRRWRDLLLVIVGLAVELSVFLTANEVVRRPRPAVHKLGIEPATFSFPSGHIAATVVLYGSIALLVTLSFRRHWWVKIVWLVPVVFAGIVGWARVYRGMHHVSDVIAGSLLGIGSLLVAIVATRASALAVQGRRDSGRQHHHREPLPPDQTGVVPPDGVVPLVGAQPEVGS